MKRVASEAKESSKHQHQNRKLKTQSSNEIMVWRKFIIKVGYKHFNAAVFVVACSKTPRSTCSSISED
jgi:hypothetical protein